MIQVQSIELEPKHLDRSLISKQKKIKNILIKEKKNYRQSKQES